MSENDQTLKNDDLTNDLSELLLKHGVSEFVICYKVQHGESESKVIYYPSCMDEYAAAQAAAYAKNTLSKIVMDQIS